jgi:hypothetical protein
MTRPHRQSAAGQLPLPLPDPEEARRMTAELLDRIERDRQPAKPVPWLLPLGEPPRKRRPPPTAAD